MNKVALSTLLASALVMTACGDSTPAAPPPAPLTSGFDLANFDRSVRPQDDFYKFVNGTWLAKTELPAEKSSYGSFDQLFDLTEQQVKDIIESSAKDTNHAAGSVAQQVGDLYASFMDEARADELGYAPIKGHLDRIAAVKSMSEFATLAGELSNIGVGGISGEYIEPDAKDPTANIVYINQAGISLPEREYYLSNESKYVEIRQKYVDTLTKFFTMIGRANAAADAKTVLAFETELAKLRWTPAEARNAIKTYNKMAIADLGKSFPGWDWASWLKVQKYDVVPNVVIGQPSYFKGIGALATSKPLDTWKTWLTAKVVMSEARLLSQPFVDTNFEFFAKTLFGQQENRPRWKRGVSFVNGAVGEAVGELYVKKHFPAESKARMDQLVKNLLAAYGESIKNLDWMTDATKQQALAKLAKFTTKIGYPDKFRSYAGLTIKADDLVGNAERATRFEQDFQTSKLGKPVDRSLWLMNPQDINAYYNPVQNEIVFPAAILQPPFFDPKAEDAVNYGAIGAVIGHEIGHGFDDQGRHYDGDGKLNDWWTKEDDTEFQKRARMLVAQFDALEPLPGLHVKGELTLGENIGDLGGLAIAYKAYKASLGGKPSPTIDGFTGEQRVFIGLAQVWREKDRDEFLRLIVTSDEHAPSMYRGSMPMTNVDAFYDAFDVKPGDKMFRKPEERVRIW
jgi:predicted metalloendopeptidase